MTNRNRISTYQFELRTPTELVDFIHFGRVSLQNAVAFATEMNQKFPHYEHFATLIEADFEGRRFVKYDYTNIRRLAKEFGIT